MIGRRRAGLVAAVYMEAIAIDGEKLVNGSSARRRPLLARQSGRGRWNCWRNLRMEFRHPTSEHIWWMGAVDHRRHRLANGPRLSLCPRRTVIALCGFSLVGSDHMAGFSADRTG